MTDSPTTPPAQGVASYQPNGLLPCPFCEGEATRSVGLKGNRSPWAYIECIECAAMADPEIWNSRTRPPAGAEGGAKGTIYYVCAHCEKQSPEGCCYLRDDLRVMPDGGWICENCYDGDPQSFVTPPVGDFDYEPPRWHTFPTISEYAPVATLPSVEQAREAAFEEAARWHDEKAKRVEDWPAYRTVADLHRHSAAAIRQRKGS